MGSNYNPYGQYPERPYEGQPSVPHSWPQEGQPPAYPPTNYTDPYQPQNPPAYQNPYQQPTPPPPGPQPINIVVQNVHSQAQSQAQAAPIYVAPPRQSNGLATAGLVFGIIGLVFSLCAGWAGLPFCVLGAILSGIAMSSRQKGNAVTGLVCSLIGIGLAILNILFLGALWATIITTS